VKTLDKTCLRVPRHKKIQYFQGFSLDEPTEGQYYSPQIGPVGGPGLLQGGL
jgi:hypothetical protein